LNIERFIAKRIIKGSENSNQLSSPIVKISVVGIALGLAVMILSVAVVKGFQNEIRDKLIGFGSHIQVVNYNNNESTEQLPISSNHEFIKKIKSTKNVKHLQQYATKSGIVKTKTDNEGLVLKGVGEDYDWNYIRENLKAGNTLSMSDTGLSKGIIISTFLSKKLDLNLSDKVVVYFLTKKEDSTGIQYQQRAKAFYVDGIYETGFEEIDKKMAIVDIRHIQKLNYWDANQVTGFELTVNKYEDIDVIGEELDELAGIDLSVFTIKELNPTVFSWLDLMDMNAIIILLLMIIVAGINMVSALLILILERTNMIGVLKALGANNWSIQKVFLYNAAYLIGKGLVWGNVIALLIAFIQLKFGIFKLDAESYYISQIPIYLNASHILLLNIGSLLSCIVMLIIPSFIVSKISPIKAIKYE